MAKRRTTSRKPRLHTFSKEIVKEGKYLTRNPDGSKTYKDVTKEDIEVAVNSFNEMKERGLKVPAPWKHDLDITVEKVVEGDDGVLEDSTKNAGFWTELSCEENDEGQMVLHGKIQAPGNPNDPDTPAGKIGTSVQDTSIYMKRKYELTDDSGDTIDNALMHIALVSHPIEPGQENFQLEGEESLAMSQGDLVVCMSQYLDPSDLSELAILLSETVNLYLPAGTTMDSLVPNLTIALEQCKMSKKKDNYDNSTSNSDNTFQMEPVVMNLSKKQQDALINGKVDNPDTGRPYQASDFAEQANPEPAKIDIAKDPVVMGLTNTLKATNQSNFRNRINGLIESGRVTKEYADSNLIPEVDNYSPEFGEDGSVKACPLEGIIMGLESVPAPVKASAQNQDFEELNPNDDPNQLSEEDMDSVAADLLAS